MMEVIRFTIVNGTNIVYLYSSVITDGNWHYITVTRNGTSGDSKIYVDGTLNDAKKRMFTLDFSSPSAKLEIGCYNNATVLNGSLDEVAIHNVELQPEEIQQHYNNGLLGFDYYETIAPVITTTAPLDGVVGQLYSYDIDATGNPAPTYSLTIFPAGMTINSSTGLIEWTPATSGNFDVRVEASNGVYLCCNSIVYYSCTNTNGYSGRAGCLLAAG